MDNQFGLIYEIRNTTNDKRYVGSTIDPKRRKVVHFRKLRQGKHHSIVLQRAFDKYGEGAFFFSVIEENIPQDYLIEREQYWLEKLQPEYNIAKIAGSRIGVPASEETKAKMRTANKGRVLSSEHKEKIGNALRGRVREINPEWRDKLTASCFGRVHTLETKAKLSKARMGSVPTNRKSVQQVDVITGEIIRTWPCMAHASNELGIDNGDISKVASGKNSTAGGFKWRYVNG
jgi:group I intron endonuclease